MRHTEIYDCKRGRIYLTGDSYGMSVCVCLGTYPGDPYPLVHFADVITGHTHTAGHAPGHEHYSDDAYKVGSTTEEELKVFIEKWELTQYAQAEVS